MKLARGSRILNLAELQILNDKLEIRTLKWKCLINDVKYPEILNMKQTTDVIYI